MKILPLIIMMLISAAIPIKGKVDYRQFMYDHVGLEQGLASQRVYSMVEDRYGGMWIGMKNGVARCNGRTLVNYSLWEPDKWYNNGGMIVRLTKDHNGDIVAYDNKGAIYKYVENIDRYVPIAEDFTNTFNEINNKPGGLILKDIDIDSEGTIWASTSRGIFKIAKGSTRRYFNHLYVNNTIVNNRHLVICTTTGTFLFDLKTNTIIKTLLNENTETAYCDNKKQWLWLGTFSNGAVIVDMKTWKTVHTDMERQLPHTPVRTIERLNDEVMMLGIDGNGVYTASTNGTDIRLLWSDDDKTNNVIHGNGVYQVLRDSHDNIWIGTYTGGIDIAYPVGTVVQSLQHRKDNSQSLINNGVNSVMANNGLIYFGTDRGVSIFDTKKSQWRHTLDGKVVLTLANTHLGILAGTYGSGVYVINGGESRPLWTVAAGTLTTDYVYSIKQDKYRNIWIGGLDGNLIQMTPNKECKQFDIKTVQCIINIADGSVVVGTANGFFVINPNTGTTVHHFHTEELKGKGINSYITSMLAANDHKLWIGTDGGGIYTYNLKSKKIKNINMEDGLPSNCVYSLAQGAKGNIFVGTDAGLSFIKPNTEKVVNFNFVNGIDREYNRMAMEILDDGRVVCGSNSGAVIVNSWLIDMIDYKGKLRLLGLNIQSEELDDDSKQKLFTQLTNGKISLSNSQNTFRIDYECICYRFRKDILFQYCLHGFNEKWSALAETSSVEFTNLPAGNYKLEVRAVSSSNGRVIDSRTVDISVAEPWWNSLWAWTLYIMILTTIAVLLLRNYHGRLERRYFNEKINFFVNAAHDIRTPLSLVLAPLSDIASDKTLSEKSRRCIEIAQSNGNKLHGLITELLDFQKADTMGEGLVKTEIMVNTMLTTQVEKFQHLAKEKKISMEITDCDLNAKVLMDVKLSGKLFDNLLSNAIKYTPEGGHVWLKAWTETRKVYIEVKDDGIGIPKAAQKNIFKNFYRAENAINISETGSGIGLMLARRIVALHDGKLTFKSEEGKGTSFIITLPSTNTSHSSLTTPRPSLTTPLSSLISTLSSHQTALPSKATPCSTQDTILFVDDNNDLRDYIQIAFSDIYTVVTLDSGEAAMEWLKNNECDIVVSDVMMPGMNGDELCRRIKDNPDTSWMPVILLTAKAGKDFMIEGLNIGADDYVTKPFDTDILKSKIATTLANRRRASEYYKRRIVSIAQVCHTTEHDTTENAADSAFIDKATSIVISNLSDENFGIEELCREMAMSRTLFYGKLKTLTAQTPQDFVRTIRLERAAALLRDGKGVQEVSVLVGFTNTKHFSTVFKKHFGVSPSKIKENASLIE